MKPYDGIAEHFQNIDYETLKVFLYWIEERYTIHIKKDVLNQAAPWTEDKFLKEYSFTNVRRRQDRVTKFIYNHVCNNPKLTLRQKVCNLIWFRVFNSPQTFLTCGFPITEQILRTKFFGDLYKKYAFLGQQKVVSRGAYMNSGTLKRYNDYQMQFPTYMMPFYRIWSLYNSEDMRTFIKALDQNNTNKVFEMLRGIKGIADFLAFQIYIDLSYCPETQLTQNDFVHLGEGALKGIKYVCPTIPATKRYQFVYYVQEHLNQWLETYRGTNLNELMSDLPEQDRVLSLSNTQNCFCQFSKYMALQSEKKGKMIKYGRKKNYPLGVNNG